MGLTNGCAFAHTLTMMIPNIPAKKYLDDLRSNAGLTDRDIAEAVGLCRTSIYRLRIGKHKTTAHEAGIKIANLHAVVFKNNNKKKQERMNG